MTSRWEKEVSKEDRQLKISTVYKYKYKPKKANHSKGWDAKLPTYVPHSRDMVAGLPGERSASCCVSHLARRMEVLQ